MKTTHLSIKELAAFIGVSTDTIRRAVRRGEIPATRVSPHVYAAERRGQFVARSACAPGGTAGRAQANPPPSGTTGALPTGIVTGGLKNLGVHPSHSPLIGSPSPCHLAPSTTRWKY